jgi:hypothetical protein
MAAGKAPKNMRRPKNISKDDWDRLSMTGKKNALLKAGDDEGYRVMSRGAGRIQHASKDPKRAGEARTVTKNMRGMASKLNDPMVRAELGGRNIMRTNKKLNRAGMAKGKAKAGSDDALNALRKTIKEAMDFTRSEFAKNAARAAKRLK